MTPEQRAAAIGVLTQAMLAAGVSGDDAAAAAPALVDEAARQRDAGRGTVTAQLAGTVSGQQPHDEPEDTDAGATGDKPAE